MPEPELENCSQVTTGLESRLHSILRTFKNTGQNDQQPPTTHTHSVIFTPSICNKCTHINIAIQVQAQAQETIVAHGAQRTAHNSMQAARDEHHTARSDTNNLLLPLLHPQSHATSGHS